MEGALSWGKHASSPRPSLTAKYLLLRLLWKDRCCHPVRAVDDGDGPGGGSITTSKFGDLQLLDSRLWKIPKLIHFLHALPQVWDELPRPHYKIIMTGLTLGMYDLCHNL